MIVKWSSIVSISVTLNGKQTVLEKTETIGDLLREKGLEHNKVVVEVNRNIIKQDQFEQFTIKNRDKVEVLRFVGGG
jgi:thiamine biosynthesis protein ThiS